MLRFLKKIDLGETVSKKIEHFLKFFVEIFKFLKIRDSLKTAPVAAIPVNPFCWSKSAKHDVTMTSLTADLL